MTQPKTAQESQKWKFQIVIVCFYIQMYLRMYVCMYVCMYVGLYSHTGGIHTYNPYSSVNFYFSDILVGLLPILGASDY